MGKVTAHIKKHLNFKLVTALFLLSAALLFLMSATDVWASDPNDDPPALTWTNIFPVDGLYEPDDGTM